MNELQKIAIREILDDLDAVYDATIKLSIKANKSKETITNEDAILFKIYVLASKNKFKLKALLESIK